MHYCLLLPIIAITFPIFLLLISQINTLKKVFTAGWCFGFGFFLAGLYWISFALLVDIDSFGWLIPFAVLIIPAILAVYVGLIALITKLLSKNKYQLVISFTCLWVIAEIIRVNILSGFPWLLIGYSLCLSDSMIQFASILGIYGLSLVTLCAVCPLYLLLNHYRKLDLFIVIGGFVIFVTNFCYGYHRLEISPTNYTDTKIRIVQANIEQTLKWDTKQQTDNLLKHMNLSKINNDNIDYVIWPESAITFHVSLDDQLQAINILSKNSYLLTGGIRINDTRKPSMIWNTIFVINSTGKIVDFYDKAHLVPFGEYIPLKNFIPVTKITHGTLDFTPGAVIKTIKPNHSLPSFSPLICYEAYFPENVILKEQQPNFIVNFTNDSWYGNTSGPYQHLHMTRLRAVEQGMPVIRAANTGISAVIDSYGRITKKLSLNSSGVIDSYLPNMIILPTLYNRYGNLLISSILIIFLLLAYKICYPINLIVEKDSVMPDH